MIDIGAVAQWDSLIDRLEAAGPSVRVSWQDLDTLVGGLPPSASKHRAWWSGDRPHVHAWRSAGFALADLRMGHEVTFVRVPEGEDRAGTTERVGSVEITETAAQAPGGAGPADLLLVTCVKSKRDVPAAAKDLYVSPLFIRQRAYAESRDLPWFILSAEHGLVAPEEWLAPYERYLPDTPAAYRAAWGRWVSERLDLLAGPLSGTVVEIHAGAPYVQAIAPHLTAKGAAVVTPLDGLSMGQRLGWYAAHGAAPAAPAVQQSQSESAQADTASVVALLRDPSRALTPAEFLASAGEGWRTPGLYSWWVDASGAADLTAGLGIPVAPGLIYAGLAGATRWPSGKRSTNTLWSRIAGMHLGGRHEFSTFRRTLGAVLAHADGSATIDEDALTAWMTQHLTVVALASEDADTLGLLESEVLATLDPPLNLQGMAATPVRSRLTELRRPHR